MKFASPLLRFGYGSFLVAHFLTPYPCKAVLWGVPPSFQLWQPERGVGSLTLWMSHFGTTIGTSWNPLNTKKVSRMILPLFWPLDFKLPVYQSAAQASHDMLIFIQRLKLGTGLEGASSVIRLAASGCSHFWCTKSQKWTSHLKHPEAGCPCLISANQRISSLFCRFFSWLQMRKLAAMMCP